MSNKLILTATPTIDTGLYASGDAVGGLLTFDGAGSWPKYSGTILKVVIIDKDSEKAPLDLVLFDRTFTATADQAAFDPTDADLANYIGFINVAASDYVAFNDNSVAVKTSGSQMPFDYVLNGNALYGQLVVRSGPTYTATTDLKVKIVVEVD